MGHGGTNVKADKLSTPTTSSVSDYVKWVVDHVLTDAERSRVLGQNELRVGSVCAGMGTEEIVLTALSNAFTLHNRTLSWLSAFKAELDKRKMDFLLRHYGSSRTLCLSLTTPSSSTSTLRMPEGTKQTASHRLTF